MANSSSRTGAGGVSGLPQPPGSAVRSQRRAPALPQPVFTQNFSSSFHLLEVVTII